MSKGAKILKSLIIYFGAFTMLLPFLWMLSTSLKPPEEIFVSPIKWLPSYPYIKNYINAVTFFPFVKFLTNSVIVTLGIIVGQLITSVLAAYAFARIDFPGREVLFVILLSALMLPAQTIMIPMVIILQKVGLINTLQGLIVPFSWSALIVFLLRQFFMKLPLEVEESAKIDGCSLMQILIKIILPISKPIISTAIILIFVYAWNQYFWPLLIVSDEKYYTLQLGLSYFKEQNLIETDWGALMAGTALVMVPVILVFTVFQKKVIESIAFSGSKE